MPSNEERWLDAEAGPVVRPYALPTTVADIAADVDLPLGVVRVILADLRELGLVVISVPMVMAERVDKHTLREVLNGLRGL